MMQTPSQAESNERSKRFHASIAEKAVEQKTCNQKAKADVPPALRTASYNERLAALELQVQELRAALVRQADMIIKFGHANNGGSARLITPPKISEIIDVACDFYGLTRTQLCGPQRDKQFTKPRHIVCYLARKLTLHSLPEIGMALGDRDHTTILHGDRKIKKELWFDPVLKDDIDILELKIEEKILNRETPRGQQVVHRLPTP